MHTIFLCFVMSIIFCRVVSLSRGNTSDLVATSRWRHNGRDGVSNHQPQDCLLNHLFRRRSKKTSKLRVTGLCAGIHRGPMNSPHKWPVTRKMFPFHDVIMFWWVYVADTHPQSNSSKLPLFSTCIAYRGMCSTCPPGCHRFDYFRLTFLKMTYCKVEVAVVQAFSLRWRHNGRDGVSNHKPHDCLLNRLFGHRSK